MANSNQLVSGDKTMISTRWYCIYNGAEYLYDQDMQDNYLIMTTDKAKTDSSFIDQYHDGVYSKIINKDEISDIYKKIYYGKLGNLKFHIDNETEDSYVVFTDARETAKKLGIREIERNIFVGNIPKDGVIISMVKKPFKLE